ncbi:MAG TPA: phage/plasmid primase, P4 family [Polyangiaceae bacterium]
MTRNAAVVPLDRRPFFRGDHVEIAERLVSKLRATGEVVYDDGAIWQYNDDSHVFEVVPAAELSRITQGFAGCELKGTKKPLRLSAGAVSGSIKLAEDLLAKPGFFADAPPGLVFSDSFVEVHASGIAQREHSTSHRARFAYSFGFQRHAHPTRFLEFLAQIFVLDEDAAEKTALLQEFVGAAMLGLCTRYQRAVTKVGAGANGKGVLASIIENAMPPGSCVAIAPQDFGDEYRAAMLAGKRLNIVSELPEADILDSEAFKAVISGDTRTARHIRQAPFTFRPVAGHIFAANRLPGTADHTHGFWRRVLVLTFNRVFAEAEQEPELAKRIVSTELPAVVSWFLAGAQRVLAQGGYTIAPSSAKAVDSWRKNADQVRAFADASTTKLVAHADLRDGTPAEQLYRAYRYWAQDNGHRAMASNKFGERMAQLGLGAKHTRYGNFYPVKLERGDDP